jgi:pimeloyl-ACP methyl ester carboxylesterase
MLYPQPIEILRGPMFRIIFPFILLGCLTASGADYQLSGAKTVEMLTSKTPTVYKRLKVADLPELDTRLIYPSGGYYWPKSKGLVFLLPGTSGRIDSEYGFLNSQIQLADYLQRSGYSVIALQQPLYWLAENEIARLPILEKYSHLINHLRWFKKIFEKFSGPFLENPEPQPIYLIGRSWGAMEAAELVHQRLIENTEFQFVDHFTKMLFMGFDGTLESQIDLWHRGEVQHFIIDRPESGDAAVVRLGPILARQMSWQKDAVEDRGQLSKLEIIIGWGSSEEYCDNQQSTMMIPILDFGRLHPGLAVTAACHPGYHNMAKMVPSVPEAAKPLGILRSVLDDLFDTKPVKPGFRTKFYPSRETVYGRLLSAEAEKCRLLLAGFE